MKAKIERLKEAAVGVWMHNRYPSSLKLARRFAILWALALFVAVISAMLNLWTRDWGNLIFICCVGAFDMVMLHRCFEGWLWRRDLDRTLKQDGPIS